MQKVVWPITIVQIEREMPLKLKKEFSAMPVIIPGRASGSTKRKLTASFPKNVVRWMAKAAHDPRMSARAVAVSAAWIDSLSDVRTSASFQVEVNHLSVRPGIGQLSMFDLLKAYRKISRRGTNRKSRMSTVQTARAIRVMRPSIERLQSLEGPEAFGREQIDGHDRHRDN